MKEYKQCPNGHYYTGAFCPYCTNDSDAKIKDDTVWTPISENASDLRNNTNIILAFDSAPDGIKRYVEINRKYGDLYLKSNLSRMIGCDEDDIPDALDRKAAEIDELLTKELLKKNIFSIVGQDHLSSGEYYLSEKTISSIVPDTLFSQILGKGSKLDLLYEGNENGNTPHEEFAANTAASASFGDEEFQNARKEIESKKYLSIYLNDNSKKVLCIPERTGDLCIKTVDEYFSEDVSILRPKVVIKEYGKSDVEMDFESNSYSEILAKVANHDYQSFNFKVSRQRVAEVLASLFEKLSDLHKSGMIHCDLKPQNILCLKDGLVPFDPINVRKGEISAGMTANYCAPEQILTMPVSPATDIYNLGLMILSIIDGVVYGKTSTYIIPIGEGKVKEVRLLTEPMIFIDYNSSNIEKKEGIVFWKSFLEKCLAFDSRNRFPNVDSFANEYIRLLELYPLCNDIEFSPNFGRLSLVRHGGVFDTAWFINAE